MGSAAFTSAAATADCVRGNRSRYDERASGAWYLNTPRLVADATGTTVWRWDQAEPFGDSPASENPSGAGTFDLPLRLPGQYYDAESGLHQNNYRDYDPSIGRYSESDPIGLAAGTNTYTYVGGSPLSWSDFLGLYATIYHGSGTSYYSDIPVIGSGCVQSRWLGDSIQWVPCGSGYATTSPYVPSSCSISAAFPPDTGGPASPLSSSIWTFSQAASNAVGGSQAHKACVAKCLHDQLMNAAEYGQDFAKEVGAMFVVRQAVRIGLMSEEAGVVLGGAGSAGAVGTAAFFLGFTAGSLHSCDQGCPSN